MKNPENWGIDTAQAWAVALTDLHMTEQEFATACQKSLSLEWFPTAPADFLKLGRVASEYPDTQTAFEVACRNCGMRGNVKRNWVHDVVRETANRIGWGKLANANYGFVEYFSDVYQQVVSEHKNGATFAIPKSHRIERKPKPMDWNSPKGKEISSKINKIKRGAVA